MKDVAGYLQSRSDEASAASDQALADLWADARDLHAKKLWHQLTGVLARLVDMPDKVDLTALYDNVVSECETKLQPLRLANLAVPIARAAKDLEAALKFLDRIGGKVKDHAEASALVKVTQANECLRREQKEQMPKVKGMLEEIGNKLDEVDSVGQVHKEFYRLSSEYHKLQGEHSQYYQSCLRFLGCSELGDQSDEENRQLAFFLALAALLGEDVFNFGELLAHPVVAFLEKSAEDKWLVELLVAFNSGDVAGYNKLKAKWSRQADLKAKEGSLYEKLCLLALLNMSFECSATRRQLDFADVSARTGLSADKVELLVMKALSRGLVRGEIDQVSQTIHISWVKPRVLDRKQLGTLVSKIDEWTTSIAQMENLIQANASDILTV